LSAASSSPIREWTAGLYGPGLIIVFHNHSVDGRGLYILTDPIRPFNSTNLETELTALKWEKLGGNDLGFTPENAANKDTDGTLASNSDTKYPSQKAVKTYVDVKSAGIVIDSIADADATHAPSRNAVFDALALKENIASKATDFSTVDNTKYPTTQAVLNEILARVAGLSWKASVSCATTANITLSGEQTIDGFATSSSRVLVKNQSTASQNGIYVSGSGAWTRATDADSGTELEGASVRVQQGTSNADTTWVQTADGITLGSTSISWTQLGTSIPDASSSIKGIAKLYSSSSLGTNTDGAPDQNAVKTYVDGLTGSSSETVKGVVEEATDVETAAGTSIGGTGAKLFITPAKFATLWTALKAAAQTFTNLTATAFKISGQAAATGKKNGVLILDDGTVQKVAWVEHDTTNKTITETGVDDLVSTTLREWKNSSGNSIMKILNGQQVEIGGTTFVIQVGTSVASGNARLIMNDNQAMCYVFQDTTGKEYFSIKSTDNDEFLDMSVPERFRPLISTVADANFIRNVFRFTSGTTASATQVVGSISLPTDGTACIIWVRWQGVTNDGTFGWGRIMHGIQRTSASTVQVAGTADSSIQRSSGDFAMELVANDTNKRIDLSFTNNTTTGKAFVITAQIEYVIVNQPA